jgi:signal peptide peptidase SppA
MKSTLFDHSGLAAINPARWGDVVNAYRADAPSEPFAAALRAAAVSSQAPPEGVAVVRVHGVITKGTTMMSLLLGGTSMETLSAVLQELRTDRSVRTIVLDFDSPGGGVYGVDETAEVIADISKRKPVVAYVSGMCASAAYWLASACDRIVATPSAEVGSIGVYAIHFDESGAFAKEGIVPTLVKAGEHKAEANPYNPLSDEDRAAMQSRIDAYYAMFTKRVARGRRVSVDQVRGDAFGAGRVLGASDARSSGMVDATGTFEDACGMTRETSARAAQAADSLLALRVRAARVAC